MAQRSFTDSSGREWHVWRVVPLAADRRQQSRRIELDGFDGERDGSEPRSGQDRRNDPARAAAHERRTGMDRRQLPGRRSELDRRTGSDRRVAARARVFLPGNYSSGWLCFESKGDKRRLTPVPEDWERASDDELIAWLASAASAQSRRAGLARPASTKESRP